MVFQSFAVKLKRNVHVACNRSLVSAPVALLCSAASRVDFAQVWRVGSLATVSASPSSRHRFIPLAKLINHSMRLA